MESVNMSLFAGLRYDAALLPMVCNAVASVRSLRYSGVPAMIRFGFVSLVLAVLLQAAPSGVIASQDPILVGSIHDTSGIFGHYGSSMDKAVTLAVEEINASGGLLGRPLKKVAWDTRSNSALYQEYTDQLIEAQVDVVHGAILSSDRETVRQQLREAGIPYFYNTQYEGGVCDGNAFLTGVTPAQQAQVLLPETVSRWGDRVAIVAADYNYGRITAKWVQFFAEKHGADIVDLQFIGLDNNDFTDSIEQLAEAQPDFVVSILVGGAHLEFYRQWSTSGLKGDIPIASTTMGAGNEQLALTADEVEGMMMVYSYSRELPTASNKFFLRRWAERYGNLDGVHELAVATYQGVNLWAEAVRRAGTVERDAVIEELRGKLKIDAPTGTVSIDPLTHHVVTTVQLVEVKDQRMEVVESFPNLQPLDTQIVCNLMVKPDDNEQYAISVELYDVMFPTAR
jgi:branched-chain amino acid transport system substrate-binding protein